MSASLANLLGRAVPLPELVARRGELASRRLRDPRRQPPSATAAAARAPRVPVRVTDPRPCPGGPGRRPSPLVMTASRARGPAGGAGRHHGSLSWFRAADGSAGGPDGRDAAVPRVSAGGCRWRLGAAARRAPAGADTAG